MINDMLFRKDKMGYGYSSMVEHWPSKWKVRIQFPAQGGVGGEEKEIKRKRRKKKKTGLCLWTAA
jgi:hypothetical protein